MSAISFFHERQLEVRLIGSLAIAAISGDTLLGRPTPAKDIDVVALSRIRPALQEALTIRGWQLSARSMLAADRREQFSDENEMVLDVFYDGIDGNHRIDLRERLFVTFPTISWTDLLLSKLQRVEMRASDVWDVHLLLERCSEQLDKARWRDVLGGEWGLYTTVTDNLTRWRDRWPRISVEQLRAEAECASKSLTWQARGFVGRRMRWWTPVYTE
jgi:hypothetical protein